MLDAGVRGPYEKKNDLALPKRVCWSLSVICDTVICSKKYIFGLSSLFLAHNS